MGAAVTANFPTISMRVEGVEETGRKFERLGTKVDSRGRNLTRHYGAALQADIRGNARRSFRVTNYADRIRIEHRQSRGWVTSEVGTDEPQGYRLEQGFVGRDARGRFASQPPRPHFLPAAQRIGARYQRALAALIKDETD